MAADGAVLIGVTGRRFQAHVLGVARGFADAPLETYFEEYAQSIVKAGGVPVHIPTAAVSPDVSHALLSRLDGIIIAGGNDIDPRRFGDVPDKHTSDIDPIQDQAEVDLILGAIEHDIPLLGVCRGEQVMNVALGGGLVTHLELGQGESHGSFRYPRAERTHPVALDPGCTLASIYGTDFKVNSFHHQAVGEPGDNVDIVGRAPDGVVEAIEVRGARALGVQWHPETFGGDPIFDWLVTEARR